MPELICLRGVIRSQRVEEFLCGTLLRVIAECKVQRDDGDEGQSASNKYQMASCVGCLDLWIEQGHRKSPIASVAQARCIASTSDHEARSVAGFSSPERRQRPPAVQSGIWCAPFLRVGPVRAE